MELFKCRVGNNSRKKRVAVRETRGRHCCRVTNIEFRISRMESKETSEKCEYRVEILEQRIENLRLASIEFINSTII